MEKTRHAGIYRRGGRYVFSYRLNGKQRWESARTLDEARKLKAAQTADLARGEFSQRSNLSLHGYAREWIDRYQGTGRRGFREETRGEYRALLEKYALTFFPEGTGLTELTPRTVADFIGWLVRRPNRSGGSLADSSVRNALKPLSACLATARREGLIRHNPAADATLPHRPRIEEHDEDRRPLSREQLAAFLAVVHPRHRLLFDFAARTGLRASEVIGLDGRHLQLDGESPSVRVRQRYRRGRVGPIKTRYARRDVPLASDLVDELRALRVAADAPVFTSSTGGRLDRDNMLARVIKPAAQELDASWVGWHTFRHTCASILFAEGRNAVQVQRWLGHHSPSFTLDTYVHLLEEDLGAPLEPLGVNKVRTSAPFGAAEDDLGITLESPV
jgi:integrase